MWFCNLRNNFILTGFRRTNDICDQKMIPSLFAFSLKLRSNWAQIPQKRKYFGSKTTRNKSEFRKLLLVKLLQRWDCWKTKTCSNQLSQLEAHITRTFDVVKIVSLRRAPGEWMTYFSRKHKFSDASAVK